MPTKQQYLGRINAIKAKKTDLPKEDIENYKEIKARIPQGRDAYGWIYEQKQENKKNWDMVEPKYQKALTEAKEFVQKKKETLITNTQNTIKSLGEKIIEEKKKERMDIELVSDLRHQKEMFEESLKALNKNQDDVATQFSFGPAEWSLDMTEYEPYYDAKTERDDLLYKLSSYDKFLDTKKIVEADEEEYQKDVRQMKSELDGKKTAFNSLSGWQKFWARVLPASWYSKAQDYADIKAQENAMKETGVIDKDGNIVEEAVEEAEVKQPVGESLPENVSKDLQQKSELNGPNKEQEPEQKIHYEEREKTLDEDEYVDEYEFGEEMEP